MRFFKSQIAIALLATVAVYADETQTVPATQTEVDTTAVDDTEYITEVVPTPADEEVAVTEDSVDTADVITTDDAATVTTDDTTPDDTTTGATDDGTTAVSDPVEPDVFCNLPGFMADSDVADSSDDSMSTQVMADDGSSIVNVSDEADDSSATCGASTFASSSTCEAATSDDTTTSSGVDSDVTNAVTSDSDDSTTTTNTADTTTTADTTSPVLGETDDNGSTDDYVDGDISDITNMLKYVDYVMPDWRDMLVRPRGPPARGGRGSHKMAAGPRIKRRTTTTIVEEEFYEDEEPEQEDNYYYGYDNQDNVYYEQLLGAELDNRRYMI